MSKSFLKILATVAIGVTILLRQQKHPKNVVPVCEHGAVQGIIANAQFDSPTPSPVRFSWGYVARAAAIGVRLWSVPMACRTVRYGWDATRTQMA